MEPVEVKNVRSVVGWWEGLCEKGHDEGLGQWGQRRLGVLVRWDREKSVIDELLRPIWHE